MRDRLIELIEKILDEGFAKHIPLTSSFLADHLLAEGVIVLPCEVGDILYMPWEWNGQKGIACLAVIALRFFSNFGWRFETDFSTDDEDYYEAYNCGSFGFDDFGKTVFLTHAEAESALAERSIQCNTN